MKLHVFFKNDDEFDGESMLVEHLETDDCTLYLKKNGSVASTAHLINKAINILKHSYKSIEVLLHCGKFEGDKE